MFVPFFASLYSELIVVSNTDIQFFLQRSEAALHCFSYIYIKYVIYFHSIEQESVINVLRNSII